jgi:catechol 2,3-dioxygenase-like lactoylglutathione lyase family enzyme
MKAVGATVVFESAENGQMIVDLPGGVRVEILADRAQREPIVFHHAHVATLDGAALREWYVRVFGAEPGERRNLPSAVVPGGRVDFLPAKTAPRPSKGAAIDHLGFEARDLAAFVARLKTLNVPLEPGTANTAGTGAASGFLVDPSGASIEVTRGPANDR